MRKTNSHSALLRRWPAFLLDDCALRDKKHTCELVICPRLTLFWPLFYAGSYIHWGSFHRSSWGWSILPFLNACQHLPPGCNHILICFLVVLVPSSPKNSLIIHNKSKKPFLASNIPNFSSYISSFLQYTFLTGKQLLPPFSPNIFPLFPKQLLFYLMCSRGVFI